MENFLKKHKNIGIIFPNQLFKDLPFTNVSGIIIIEYSLFFTQFKFHKKKLILHRASMMFYRDFLLKKGFSVYYQSFKYLNNIFKLEDLFIRFKNQNLHYIDTIDYLIEKRISRLSEKFNIKTIKHFSPNFLTFENEFDELLNSKKGYFLNDFYKKQRIKRGILLEGSKPKDGKWNFDSENRKKLPGNISIPKEFNHKNDNKYINEAINYVNSNFKDNYGIINNFNFPINYDQAEKLLDEFIELKLVNFGKYQDAIHSKHTFLFHSLISSSLNTGLLNPNDIISKILTAYENNSVPINSIEGFIRQLIGWREFMMIIYKQEGVKQRNSNYLNHNRKLNINFWNGNTGIAPIDDSINKVLEKSYIHHIERLMIIGNFMHLCEIHPNEVYKWFMELFIDAYDWVMVPNVYGMSQYSDGGLITTKPYVSGSNYILKMSNYRKEKWSEIWDALYWRYLFKNQVKFKDNRRMKLMLSILNRKNKDELSNQIKIAEEYINKNFEL